MRTIRMLMLLMTLINLSACSSVSGNVIPEKSPSMEQVYDSMDTPIQQTKPIFKQGIGISAPLTASNSDFHKISNPELKMYVYPHLAGKDQIPVPGYYTAFNAYTQDHYVLSNEI